MKVPVSWLREFVDFDLPVEELARRLVFTSCEVDRVVHRGVPGGANYEHFVVGKVVEADKHPNADKLQLTRVDVGESEPRQFKDPRPGRSRTSLGPLDPVEAGQDARGEARARHLARQRAEQAVYSFVFHLKPPCQ